MANPEHLVKLKEGVEALMMNEKLGHRKINAFGFGTKI